LRVSKAAPMGDLLPNSKEHGRGVQGKERKAISNMNRPTWGGGMVTSRDVVSKTRVLPKWK